MSASQSGGAAGKSGATASATHAAKNRKRSGIETTGNQAGERARADAGEEEEREADEGAGELLFKKEAGVARVEGVVGLGEVAEEHGEAGEGAGQCEQAHEQEGVTGHGGIKKE